MQAVKGIFGGGSAKQILPPAPAPAPTPEDPAALEARRRTLSEQRQRRGRASTLLTGGQGVTGSAPVARKTLLGDG